MHHKKPTFTTLVVGITALIWNLIGIFFYMSQAFMTDAKFLALSKPEQDYFANLPAWVTSIFALSVFTGFIGSFGLITNKHWGTLLLFISMLAVYAQQYYNFYMQEYIVMEDFNNVMPILLIIVSTFIFLYSLLKK
jgi:hypothetical protein